MLLLLYIYANDAMVGTVFGFRCIHIGANLLWLLSIDVGPSNIYILYSLDIFI